MSLVLTGTSGASTLDSTNGLQFATWTTGTRPASPIAGQMGYNTTTNAFDAYVNGAWVSIATSATAPTSGPAFSAGSTAAQNIPNNAWTQVTFDSKEFDTATCYSTSTNRFTPTTAGYYQIDSAVAINAPGSQFNTGISIWKNGSIAKVGYFLSNNTNGSRNIPVAALIYMNGSTDYVDIRVYQDQGGTQQTYFGTQNTYFQGFLARPA